MLLHVDYLMFASLWVTIDFLLSFGVTVWLTDLSSVDFMKAKMSRWSCICWGDIYRKLPAGSIANRKWLAHILPPILHPSPSRMCLNLFILSICYGQDGCKNELPSRKNKVSEYESMGWFLQDQVQCISWRSEIFHLASHLIIVMGQMPKETTKKVTADPFWVVKAKQKAGR